MTTSKFRRPVGLLATGLMIFITSVWAFWGAAEFYYEAWGLPFPEPLYYFMPFFISLTLTLLVFKWPRLGGWIIILLGGAFTIFIMRPRIISGQLTTQAFLSWFPVTFLTLFVGGMFIWGGQAAFHNAQKANDHPWWRRNLRFMLALGLPVLIIMGTSGYMLPSVLTRVDDGDRSARLIEGNDVRLVWAPAGPGWNWQQSWGGYPGWDALAWYGLLPIGLKNGDSLPAEYATQLDMENTGLCRFLDETGKQLMPQPQEIWRMPTTDELVRSLVYHGENAGCVWDGSLDKVACNQTPDKETPLWAPDQAPIYMWSGEEYSDEEAFFVSYNGWVKIQPKPWGNPRHGYRCVREQAVP